MPIVPLFQDEDTMKSVVAGHVMHRERIETNQNTTPSFKRSLLARLRLGVQSSKLICTSNTTPLTKDHYAFSATDHSRPQISDVITSTDSAFSRPSSKRHRISGSDQRYSLTTDTFNAVDNCDDATSGCDSYEKTLSRRSKCLPPSLVESRLDVEGQFDDVRPLQRFTGMEYVADDCVHRRRKQTSAADVTSQADQYHEKTPCSRRTAGGGSSVRRTPRCVNKIKGMFKDVQDNILYS